MNVQHYTCILKDLANSSSFVVYYPSCSPSLIIIITCTTQINDDYCIWIVFTFGLMDMDGKDGGACDSSLLLVVIQTNADADDSLEIDDRLMTGGCYCCCSSYTGFICCNCSCFTGRIIAWDPNNSDADGVTEGRVTVVVAAVAESILMCWFSTAAVEFALEDGGGAK